MPVNDQIADALTRHQVGLQRLSASTARKVLALLTRSEQRIVERLLFEDITTLSRTRQEKLLRDLRKVIGTAYTTATGALQLDLNELAVYETQYQADLFKRVIPVKLETVTPVAAQVIAAVNSKPFQGHFLKDVYAELSMSAFKQVRNTIRAGFTEGLTTDQIVRELRGTAAAGYKDGVFAKTKRETTAVVRTAINHTANTARESYYEANDDILSGVRWSSTLDGRTTSICQARDGVIYEVGKGPRPPAHWNCRSSTSPVVKSWKELGLDYDEMPKSTRASMNGQVPADLNYDGWLRRQEKGFQDEVLGKRKGDLFRGGVKVDRFVDKSGAELTLDQLRKSESAAWKATA
jgi:SPP1 gp7 family putative phage head morphogenesis protein